MLILDVTGAYQCSHLEDARQEASKICLWQHAHTTFVQDFKKGFSDSMIRHDLDIQRQLIQSLRKTTCYPNRVKKVRLIETHISWVLLAGCYAYKIKKAVNLGFLDFTDLAKRRFYCEEEIRLNQRLAPQLYLDVVAIGGSPAHPRIGTSPPFEHAVRMRRFAPARQMDRLLARAQVTNSHIDQLSATVAHFHTGLPPAPADSAFATPDCLHSAAMQNFEQLLPLLESTDLGLLKNLRAFIEEEYAACIPLFESRRQKGYIRECHGDLHAGNIVLLDGKLTPFDGIEFNARFRWIDTMSEIAFLVMDLLHHGRADLAYRFLNGYLELTGDYEGAGALRFYLAYRAMVRAKVNMIRAHQPDMPPPEIEHAKAACHSYLTLAANCLKKRQAALIIMHGLPGCGKTTVSQIALERLQAVRIRSDVERKRLSGLMPMQASHSQSGAGIYTPEATIRTYKQLYKLARELLHAGFPVIVDAAFLKHDERARFQALALDLDIPFTILSVRADTSILRQRILQRQDKAYDASEADLEVLETMQAIQEPLLPQELPSTVVFMNERDITGDDTQAAAWKIWMKMRGTLPQHRKDDG